MTNNTPGPWRFDWEPNREWGIILDKSGNIVANVNTETGPDIPPLVSQKMPCGENGKLIALTPELLAVCKTIAKWWGGDDTDIYPMAVEPDWWPMLRDTLAKLD